MTTNELIRSMLNEYTTRREQLRQEGVASLTEDNIIALLYIGLQLMELDISVQQLEGK